jgi:hypothetical protein
MAGEMEDDVCSVVRFFGESPPLAKVVGLLRVLCSATYSTDQG